MNRTGRGFSLVELAVTVAIFGILLLILVSLEGQFRRFDRSMRVEFLKHPEAEAVLARVRRDVLDSSAYPATFKTFIQSQSTLILSESGLPGHTSTIVYEFAPTTARRLEFRDEALVSTWAAAGLPQYEVGSFEMPDGTTAVRLQARDGEGRSVVDQIVTPRAHS